MQTRTFTIHPPKSCSKTRAFTLVELLVVIAIVGVLAGIALPVYNSVETTARKTQSLSSLRQLAVALVAYCGDNNGTLPLQGDSSPTWKGMAATTSAETTAWYNAVPREVGSLGGGDYATNPANFYAKGSLFYVAAAKYPTTKLAAPLFAIAYNSKLFTSTVATVRLSLITYPAETCLFLESGLAGETPINSHQSSYNGQPAVFASRAVARYNGQTVVVFADGHGGSFAGPDVVDEGTKPGDSGVVGKAYYPQNLGKVYWTTDPTANANS